MPVFELIIGKEEGLKLLKEIRELRGAKAACHHPSMNYIGNPGHHQWQCSKCGYVTP